MSTLSNFRTLLKKATKNVIITDNTGLIWLKVFHYYPNNA